MLSKEEIEYLNQCKRYLKQFYKIQDNSDYLKILDKLLQEYKEQKIQLQQLESREQKLIRELEYALKSVQEDKRINELHRNLGELKINLRCYSVEEIELFITSILKVLKRRK